MCKKRGFIIHFLLLPICCLATDELIFVNLLYRHGDRTPVKPYPTDPYRNISYWPPGFGQLTNVGKLQHYELGKWIRNRYSIFLPEKYSLNDIYVQSTDVDRTLMSAEANLAGLYAPVDSDVWDPKIDWQPIPVHSVPEKMDAVLSGKKKCDSYEAKLQELLDDAEFTRIKKQLEPLFKYISNNTGSNIYDIQKLEYFYNTLYIEDLNKLPLPEWTKRIYPEELLPWAHLSFELYCYTPALQRLKIGLLINEIFTRLANKTAGNLKPDRKIWVYSAHDTTIANVLMALGAFEPHCPPYTSTIILELRRSDSKGYYISAFYKNDTEPRPISILGCDQQCPLDKILDLLSPIMLNKDEWEEECKLDPSTTTLNIWLGGVAALFLLCSIVFLLYARYCSYRTYRSLDSDSDSSD